MSKLSTVPREKRSAVIGKWAVAFQSAAGGPQSQDMLAAWVTWIASESGDYIYGNNPLNLTCSNGDGCYTGQIGWYQFPGNSRKFAAFESREAGARAIIALLGRVPEKYGYAKILTAARKGDYVAFLTSVANSYWVNGSSGKPGYGGAKNLLSRWETWSGKKVDALPLPPDERTSNALGAFGDKISFPVGHILTQSDVDYIMSVLQQSKFFDAIDPTGNGPAITRGILEMHIGEPWNKELQDTLQTQFGQAAGLAGDPVAGIADPIASIAEALTRLSDPASWIRIFGLLLGAFMAYTGFRSLMEAS